MSQELVSIIVATYRRNESLKKALDSISEQTYPNCEIVLVDDNADPSWNETVASIVKEFLAKNKDFRLRYIRNDTNQGSAKTRNIGIFASCGEYITFLDDDDVYLPEKVSSQLSGMKESGADFGVTDLYLYDKNDRLIDKRCRSYIEKTDKDSLMLYHLKYHLTGTDTIMFKADYLREIGGFEPINIGDEYYLIEKAISFGGKFHYLPECHIKAYVHTDGDGLSSGMVKVQGEKVLFEHKKKFLKDLAPSQRRYIKMRHYAVVAYAYLRMKKPAGFFANAVSAFFASPIGCIKLLMLHKA